MPCDYHTLPHPGIQTLKPYVPGKPVEEVAREFGITDIVKLASNENPRGCSPLVIGALGGLTRNEVATYPLPSSHALLEKLAAKLKITPQMLTLGNGSDALFSLFLTCFALHKNKHIITHDYAFISYRIFAQALGISVVTTPLLTNWEVDINAIIKECNEKTALIFLANPNNPTGLPIAFTEIRRLLANIPESTILVLDEAYFEYSIKTSAENSINLLANHPNLIITRTFSKAYGLAGLRLGYAIAHETITEILRRVLPPFTVNQTAFIAAEAALQDELYVKETLRLNAEGLTLVQHELDKLDIGYLPTDGNFITINCGKDTTPIFQTLQQQGVIVRPLHPYGLPDYIRVTIGTPQQNSRFLEKFKFCMKE